MMRKVEIIETSSALGNSLKRYLMQLVENKERLQKQIHHRFADGRTLVNISEEEGVQLIAVS